MQLSAGKAITKIHSSDAQEEDGGGNSAIAYFTIS